MNKLISVRLFVIGVAVLALASIGVGLRSLSFASANTDVVNSLGGVDSVRVLALPTNDIIFNAADNKIYACTASVAGSIGNSVVPVDPFSGTIGSAVFVGSEPTKMALSADGQALYSTLPGAFSIGRFNTANQTSSGSFLIGYEQGTGLLNSSTVSVSPDDPNIVAVARQSGNSSPTHSIAIYNNGVRLPQTAQGSDFISFTESGSTLYGTSRLNGLTRYSVTANGVTVTASSSLGSGHPFKYAGGIIYSARGQIINPETMTLLGTIPEIANLGGTVLVPEPSASRVFFVVPGGSNTLVIKAFSTTTFSEVGSLTLANIPGAATSLIRWGTNGLALGTTTGRMVLIQTSLIPTPNPLPSPSPINATPTPTPTPHTATIRQIPLPINDVVYSETRQILYASVPSIGGAERGNTVTEIEPVNGTIGASTAVGSEPTQIAMSDNEQALFIGVNGAGAFRRFDLSTSTPGPLVSLGLNSQGPQVVFDLAVRPGSTDTVAVRGGSDIAIYDGGVKRPMVGNSGTNIAFGSADVLFANSGITKYDVVANGLTQSATFPSPTLGDIQVKNDRIYAANGRVVDTALSTIAGTYSELGIQLSTAAVDLEHGRIYFLTSDGSAKIKAYDLTTFRYLGFIYVPEVSQIPRSLVRWGANGLAYKGSTNLYLVQSDLVDGGTPVPQVTPTPSPTPTSPATFVRRVFVSANDLIYNAGTNSVVANVGSTDPTYGNAIVHVDPSNGQVTASTQIGTDPTRLVAADDGRTAYAIITGGGRKYDLVSHTAGPVLGIGFPPSGDIAVMPGQPNTVAIAPGGIVNGLVIIDDGITRPQSSNGGASTINSIAFADNPNVVYGFNNSTTAFDLVKFNVIPAGVTGSIISNSLITGGQIRQFGGLLYTSFGRVVDPEALALRGSFQGSGTFAIDAPGNRIFYLSGNTLSAFDLQTYARIGTTTIPGYTGTPTSLARWGANGLVFRAPSTFSSPASRIYIVQSSLVSPAVPVPTGISLNASSLTVSENSSTASFTVTRNGELSSTVSVAYATSDWTAAAGQDYTAQSGTLTFAPGETTKTISIPIINDVIYEAGNEIFALTLSNPTGSNTVLVEPNIAIVTIVDNDARPTVSDLNASVLEPNPGRTTTLDVQVRLTNPSVEAISVAFSTSNGTATAGADYIASSGQVTFAPLETVKTVPVQILPDFTTEPNETFTLPLASAVNTTISGSPATVTIRNLNHAAHLFDFDGDGKSDIGIFRPIAGASEWWINRSSTGQTFALQFGSSTDKIVPADYTGDGKADIAFFRPGSGEWFVLRSEDFSFFALPFGTNGDVPVPADYDADGKADFAVFRPLTATWFISQSGGSPTRILQFGTMGDQPAVADYDGDGKADVGVFRQAAGGAEWWIDRSTAGSLALQFGANTDKPVQGDYTGDGKADIAVWRPSDGNWLIVRSEDFSFFGFPFGAVGDTVAPGDYDGDGKFDATVFRPSSATWFIGRTTAGTQIVQFGANGDRPIPNAFVP
jgi:hypothetical protein